MNSNALRILALIAVLAVIGSAAYLMLQPGTDSSAIGEHETDTSRLQSYDNPTYGVSFSYPDSYVLTERDEPGLAQQSRHVITLMDKTAAANIPENGEGPTTISIEVFESAAIDSRSVEQWIKNTNATNFNLSPNQTLSQTTVAGVQGLSHAWDGLYSGESTVIVHKDNMLVFSVSFMARTDSIRSDFTELLRTVQLR